MIFPPEQQQALDALARSFHPAPVVLIGASALMHHLGGVARRSEDLDVTVAVELDVLDALPARLPDWRRHSDREHEWRSPHGVQVDIVPAGPALLAAGELVWPKTQHRMNLTGLDLAFRHAERLQAEEPSVGVPPVAVLTLLKMTAWLDRPHREHDLTDLCLILLHWLPIDDLRRFEPEVIAAAPWYEDAGAFLLGQEIARIAAPVHLAIARRFLDRVRDPALAAHGTLRAQGPSAWQEDEDLLPRFLEAFGRGLGQTDLP